MKNYIPLLSFWLVNSLVILLFSLLLPQNIVIGNGFVLRSIAWLWAGMFLTFLVWYSNEIAKRLGLKLKGRYKMFAFYFLANTVSVWLIARVPVLTAFGISIYYWAIVMGITLDILQWFIWQGLKKGKLI